MMIENIPTKFELKDQIYLVNTIAVFLVQGLFVNRAFFKVGNSWSKEKEENILTLCKLVLF